MPSCKSVIHKRRMDIGDTNRLYNKGNPCFLATGISLAHTPKLGEVGGVRGPWPQGRKLRARLGEMQGAGLGRDSLV